MAKTKMNVISIFDGNQDATDAFISLITEKIQANTQNDLAGKDALCYDKNKVQVTSKLASGLCG